MPSYVRLPSGCWVELFRYITWKKPLWQHWRNCQKFGGKCKFVIPKRTYCWHSFWIKFEKRYVNSTCMFLLVHPLLKENFTLIIFFFSLHSWPKIGFYDPIYKNELFFLPKLTFQHHLHKIYMAFYLLTWVYFNDVNVGTNNLINSKLKRIFFMTSDKK